MVAKAENGVMALSLPRKTIYLSLTARNEIRCRPECRFFHTTTVNKVIHISTAPRTGRVSVTSFKLNPNDTALLLSNLPAIAAFVANHWRVQNVTPTLIRFFYQLITHLQQCFTIGPPLANNSNVKPLLWPSPSTVAASSQIPWHHELCPALWLP